MSATRILAGLSAAILATVALAEPLAIKTGLWEITSTTDISGEMAIPPDVWANMSAEQRADAQAAMKQLADEGPKTETDRSCVTQEDLEEPFQSGQEGDASCRNTFLNQTAKEQRVRIECTGDTRGSGEFHIRVLDAQNVKGSLRMSSTDGEHEMQVRADIVGKWLGADCGDLADEPD